MTLVNILFTVSIVYIIYKILWLLYKSLRTNKQNKRSYTIEREEASILAYIILLMFQFLLLGLLNAIF